MNEHDVIRTLGFPSKIISPLERIKDLESRLAAAEQRAEQAEKQILDAKNAVAKAADPNLNNWIHVSPLYVSINAVLGSLQEECKRAEQAEADCAAMREVFHYLAENKEFGFTCEECPALEDCTIEAECHQQIAKHALESAIGTALLAELRQLRARLKAYGIFEPHDYKRLHAEVESLKKSKSEYSEGFKIMLKRTKQYKRALELACEKITKACNALERGNNEFCNNDNCTQCPLYRNDLNYFLAQAEKSKVCNCKYYLPLKEPMPHKVGWCAYKDEAIDGQEVGNCEARVERGQE